MLSSYPHHSPLINSSIYTARSDPSLSLTSEQLVPQVRSALSVVAMSADQGKAVDGNTLIEHKFEVGAKFTSNGAQIASAVVAGLFRKQSGAYSLWSTPDWGSFVTKFNQSLSTLDLASFDSWQQDPSTTYYTGCWLPKSNPAASQYLWRTSSKDDFMNLFNTRKSSSRLLDLDIDSSGGFQYYTGVWGGSAIPQTIIEATSINDLLAQVNRLLGQGMWLVKLQAVPVAESFHFVGLCEQGNGTNYLWVTGDWNVFYQKYQEWSPTHEMTDFQVFDDNESRLYAGVWVQSTVEHKFVYNLDWGSFVNQWQSLANQGYLLHKCIRYNNGISQPVPQWDRFFRDKLGTQAQGYAYCVMRNGVPLTNGVDFCRSKVDTQKPWSIDTRINLASVSKPITAVAVLKICAERNISIDSPFMNHMSNQFKNVGHGVDQVTIRNLLTMQSGMTWADASDQDLFPPDFWQALSNYLQKQNIQPPNIPGQGDPHYCNMNFALLHAMIDCLTGFAGKVPGNYVNWVQQNVLKPMGVNITVFTGSPDPANTATLSYSGLNDPYTGKYWPQVTYTGAGGWISSARELIKFLTGVRNHIVLSPSLTQQMLDGHLGWYTYNGIFGQYFQHDGRLMWQFNGRPDQGLQTGIVHLADGYDCLLLVNTLGFDVPGLIIQAFETRY